MKAFEATRGLWIGLGVAIVIMSFSMPLIISNRDNQESQRACIAARGNWSNSTNECKLIK